MDRALATTPHIGTDEAGKGDYFGPLVVAAVYADEVALERLPQAGIRDSKKLTDASLLKKAEIVQQIPDQSIAWRHTRGSVNRGVVTFLDLGGNRCRVTLALEYDPQGFVEKVGDALGVVSRRVEGDLARFKRFIEERGAATGAWRGSISPAGHVSHDRG